MKGRIGLLLICLNLFLFSCTVQDEISLFQEIPNQKWEYSFVPKVNIPVDDVEKSYDLFLNFKHNHVYPFSNLFYRIEIKKNEVLVSSERYELTLSEVDGKWTGKGSGSQYTHEQLIKESYQFPDTGTYTLEITQNMRENPLVGVVAAGVRLVPTNKSR